ncbi:MAG: uroporphyrinogen decarboxylase family protein [Candidatus Bathyarchaeia archaeon]
MGCIEGDKVEVQVGGKGNLVYTKYRTPKGSLTQVERKTEYGTARLRVEYLVKKVEDFEVLKYILRHQSYEFDVNLYKKRESMLSNRSEPVVTVPWGSIQRFFIVYMGFQRGVIALWKHREEVESLLEAFTENDDERFSLIKKTPFKIVNFGDNIDEGLCSPSMFKRYMLPYYHKRTTELHEAGKFCTSHWDGKVRQILPYMQDTDLDGLECVPPEPQGNVTLEELKRGLKEKVLVDGIPATHFLPYIKSEEIKTFTERLIDLFAPRIIVGISDMLPPDGDIEKVRMISKIIAGYKI